MKRLLLVLFLLLALAAGAAFALRDRLADLAVRQAFSHTARIAEGRGIRVSGFHYARASLIGFDTIAVEEARAEVALRRGVVDDGEEALFLEADRIALGVEGLFGGRFLLSLAGGAVSILDGAGMPTGQRVSDLRVEADLHLEPRRLADSLAVLEDDVRRLLREGAFRVPARIEGVARFPVETTWHEVHVRSRAELGETRLLIDEADVRAIARSFNLPLTAAETALVAANPVRAPGLLRISQGAKEAAEALHARDPGYPYDAYRHVLWSWRLTRAYGPEFAERVTDAHEVGSTYEFGEANRLMDLHNNAVGRAWALAGVPERELVRRVLTDPGVVRAPR